MITYSSDKGPIKLHLPKSMTKGNKGRRVRRWLRRTTRILNLEVFAGHTEAIVLAPLIAKTRGLLESFR